MGESASSLWKEREWLIIWSQVWQRGCIGKEENTYNTMNLYSNWSSLLVIITFMAFITYRVLCLFCMTLQCFGHSHKSKTKVWWVLERETECALCLLGLQICHLRAGLRCVRSSTLTSAGFGPKHCFFSSWMNRQKYRSIWMMNDEWYDTWRLIKLCKHIHSHLA